MDKVELQQNTLFHRYKVALAGLCACCAHLATIRESMEDGEVVDETEVKELCARLEYSKDELISTKEELGFDDGLSFMENNRFYGFEIKDGMLIGDTSKMYTILRPWYEGFVAGEKNINNYQFEVASYLLAFMAEKENASEAVSFETIDEPAMDESETAAERLKGLQRAAKIKLGCKIYPGAFKDWVHRKTYQLKYSLYMQ